MAVAKRERLTIDLSEEEHRKIKSYAALKGKTMKEFVLESIKNQMLIESETEANNSLMTKTSLLMQDIWDNDKDSVYDGL